MAKRLPMHFSYGKEGLPGTLDTTIDEIFHGKRRSTLRRGNHGLKIGDVVEVYDKTGKKGLVKVSNITQGVTEELADEVSKSERWSKDFLKRKGYLSGKYDWVQYEPVQGSQNFKGPPSLTGAQTGKRYEVSSRGDKRFSALTAKLKDGRTIEEAFQLDVKGYRKQGNNWRLGKGKPPLVEISREQLALEYKNLWKQYLNENPKLLKVLQDLPSGTVLTDQFAKPGTVSQATALTEIIKETKGTPSPTGAGKRVAIVGSREGINRKQVVDFVNSLPEGTTVVSGGARGVDKWAEEAARARGLKVDIYPADWDKLGKKAGIIRNRDIVKNADEVVAFWDGKSAGTKNTMELARQAGKLVTPEKAGAGTFKVPKKELPKRLVNRGNDIGIMVGNLPYNVTEEQLADLFAPYHSVKSVKIPPKKVKGVVLKSAGYGFVNFSEDADINKVQQAINELHNFIIPGTGNRKLSVKPGKYEKRVKVAIKQQAEELEKLTKDVKSRRLVRKGSKVAATKEINTNVKVDILNQFDARKALYKTVADKKRNGLIVFSKTFENSNYDDFNLVRSVENDGIPRLVNPVYEKEVQKFIYDSQLKKVVITGDLVPGLKSSGSFKPDRDFKSLFVLRQTGRKPKPGLPFQGFKGDSPTFVVADAINNFKNFDPTELPKVKANRGDINNLFELDYSIKNSVDDPSLFKIGTLDFMDPGSLTRLGNVIDTEGNTSVVGLTDETIKIMEKNVNNQLGKLKVMFNASGHTAITKLINKMQRNPKGITEQDLFHLDNITDNQVADIAERLGFGTRVGPKGMTQGSPLRQIYRDLNMLYDVKELSKTKNFDIEDIYEKLEAGKIDTRDVERLEEEAEEIAKQRGQYITDKKAVKDPNFIKRSNVIKKEDYAGLFKLEGLPPGTSFKALQNKKGGAALLKKLVENSNDPAKIRASLEIVENLEKLIKGKELTPKLLQKGNEGLIYANRLIELIKDENTSGYDNVKARLAPLTKLIKITTPL